MTGIQAIERKEKDLRLRPGKVKRREFEYIRHGTQALLPSRQKNTYFRTDPKAIAVFCSRQVLSIST